MDDEWMNERTDNDEMNINGQMNVDELLIDRLNVLYEWIDVQIVVHVCNILYVHVHVV